MEETINPQYQKGFNHGYLLAKHKPELMKQLEKSLTDKNEYTKGILHGRAEYRMEKMKSRLKISSAPKKSQEQKKTKGRGK